MREGDIWTDISGKKYEVVSVEVIEKENGTTVKNITSVSFNK